MPNTQSQSHTQFRASLTKAACTRLLTRRIVAVRYLSDDECRRRMWNQASVAITLDDGTTLFAARDAEGNDAGALHGVTYVVFGVMWRSPI